MPKGLEARQVRAIFFPKSKQYTFHRINMEYLASLKSMSRESISALLTAGLQGNLRRIGGSEEVLHSLRPQLEGLANQVNIRGFRLHKNHDDFRGHLAVKSREGFSAYRAAVGMDLANRKLSESLALQTTEANSSIKAAEHMLKGALQVNHRNYRAHFELGWTYLSLLDAIEHAEFHLACATRLAEEAGDRSFAVFAMRHLADACYRQQKYDKAVNIALEVIRVAAEKDPEHYYECARYIAAAGDIEVAMQRLTALVNQDPAYYVQAQTEPDFIRHDQIKQRLYDLRLSRMQRIRHYVQTTWQNHYLSTMRLPDMVDANHFFRKTFDQHVRVMAQLPYGTLASRENQIGDLILHDSEQRICREIRQRSQQYENVTELKRQRWSWVNNLGGVFLHTSAILLLACLMFFAARFVGGLLGMGALLSADNIINYIVSIVFILLIAGGLLIQFVPMGSKKLLRKQIALDQTLKLLDAPGVP